MKILIVDYIVGGGYAGEDIPLGRLAEGYAILRACIEQFALKGFKITTLLDERLLEYIRITPIHEYRAVKSHEDFLNGIHEFSEKADYSLTLAPESRGILKDLSSIMATSKSIYLGSKPEAIEVAADKTKSMALAKELGMNVPASLSVSFNDPLEKIIDKVDLLGYPLIVKPIDGVGCLGLTKVYKRKGLGFALQAAQYATGMNEGIVQEFIEGVPISTSLIACKGGVLPLSINRQNLRIDSEENVGHYLGGELPYDIPTLQEEIMDLSVRLVEKIGLQGFVGVDLVVSKEGVFVIEVNPRVTVPFVGLKRVANANLATLLVEAIEKANIDSKIKLKGYASFSKMTVPSSNCRKAKFEKVAGIDGVESPPIFVGNNSHSSLLLMGTGPTITHARQNFQRVKNEVLKGLSS